MRESCPLRLTIRYLLMFVHRTNTGQSSVSPFRQGAVCHAVSGLCTLPSFASLIKYKNPVDSLILGVGEPTKMERNFLVLLRRFRLLKEQSYFNIFVCSFLRPCGEMRRFLSAFSGGSKLRASDRVWW